MKKLGNFRRIREVPKAARRPVRADTAKKAARRLTPSWTAPLPVAAEPKRSIGSYKVVAAKRHSKAAWARSTTEAIGEETRSITDDESRVTADWQ